jgi:hypothetical protein
MAHFKTKIGWESASAIWKSWAPLRCKIAAWLFIRKRVLTADRLAKRSLPYNEKCVFCNSAEENMQHLFMGCVVVNIIWNKMLQWANLQNTAPATDDSLQEWWQLARNSLTGKNRKRLDTLAMLITWSVWRERNNRVFEKVYRPTNILLEQIKAEAKQWAIASAGRFLLEEG